ncbi:MAG: flagellar biosynthesis protein FlgD [Betaproteobacteria bacterium]|nr:flagellar biosynthesis protein FlgD [Betaproteobacteria bacterium]
MLPILAAIGTGLSVLSSIKTLSSSSGSTTGTGTNTATANATNATALAGSSSDKAPTAAADQQDRFLKLLVTQMKNQDPLNPLDNAQVTSQLAQINTVSGIEKLNTTVQSLSGSLLATQSVQSASMIGRQVYATGSYLNLVDGKAVGAVNLTQPADRVFVSIADTAGTVVRRIELGSAPTGMSGFEWDGKTDAGATAAAGQYVFQITAARGNTAIAAEPVTLGKVDGVSLSSSGMRLNLQGGGSIGMADVKQIL